MRRVLRPTSLRVRAFRVRAIGISRRTQAVPVHHESNNQCNWSDFLDLTHRNRACRSTLRTKRHLVQRRAVEVRLDILQLRNGILSWRTARPERVAVAPKVRHELARNSRHVLLEGL